MIPDWMQLGSDHITNNLYHHYLQFAPPVCILSLYDTMWYLRCPTQVPSHIHHLYHHHRVLWAVRLCFLLTFPRPKCAGLRSHQPEAIWVIIPGQGSVTIFPLMQCHCSDMRGRKSQWEIILDIWGLGLKTVRGEKKGIWEEEGRSAINMT